MKKSFLLTLVLFLTTVFASAQEKQWNLIKNNPLYICGEGVATTEAQADKDALADLISKISISVVSSINSNVSASDKNGELNEVSQFEQSVNTYSSQTLHNTKQYKMGAAPNIRVGRAILKSDVDKMFEERANKAKDMVTSAIRAERKGRVDDALRNYYWALTLLKSLQYPNSVKYKDAAGTEHVMSVWIKEQMEDILDDLKFTCVTREGDDVDLNVTYKDKPVNSASFTYWDGRQWSHLVSASDGFAKLEFVPGFDKSTYQIRVEYQFRNEAKTDKELEGVLQSVNSSEFRRSTKEIKGIKPSKKEPVKKAEDVQVAYATSGTGTFTSTNKRQIKQPTQIADNTEYMKVVTAIETAIRSKQKDDAVRQYFTADGWNIYEQLIKYGSAKIVGVPNYAFYENGSEVTARGLQMAFSFKNGTKKSFVEEVIFTFNEGKKIDNISFGLGKTAEDDILNRGAWPQNVRLTIMNFLENYKTAYALKRFDYIKSIFDDDAVIIVGKVLKRPAQAMPTDSNIQTFGKDIVKFNRLTKDEYMKQLERCFKSQEFINIQFAENTVKKANKPGAGEVYGIQIEQDYYSATYGDHGYLFLYVDFNDPKSPLIKIRTWQPTKDFSLGPSGVYGIGDF